MHFGAAQCHEHAREHALTFCMGQRSLAAMFELAFAVLLVPRMLGAAISHITDCDE